MIRQSFFVAAVFLGLAQSMQAQTSDRVGGREEIRVVPKIGERLPLDLAFRNESGADVQLRELFRGKPVVLIPVYYQCPMLCGLELNGLVRCLRAMPMTAGEDFDIITFSFDPKENHLLSAQKKSQYMRAYGRASANSGWHFLTGPKQSIEALCDAIGFRTVYDPKTRRIAHSAAIMVLTPDGRLARYFYGVEFTPRELRLAVVESSDGKIGTVADQVQLLCYMYDPTKGKYGFAIERILQAAGFVTAITLGSGIAWLLWKERQVRSRQHLQDFAAGNIP